MMLMRVLSVGLRVAVCIFRAGISVLWLRAPYGGHCRKSGHGDRSPSSLLSDHGIS